jgi:phytoene/squalene synthetase
MSPGADIFEEKMDSQPEKSMRLAAAITKAASKQTYYTIRLLVDHERIADAYRAYGYFRWVDDLIDEGTGEKAEIIAFVDRQYSILEACYRREIPADLCSEEWMLVDLVLDDREEHSGLRSYLYNMMAVMRFDAERCGQLISDAQLCRYTRKLATAVTEAMHHFIGHDNPSSHHEARYLAVTAAHITHMLRDALEDTSEGYFNIPCEYLQERGISPKDVEDSAYMDWVQARVQLARRYFIAGRECMAQIRSLRCRLAGYAYTARFEWMLLAIERDKYHLRVGYPERKSLLAGLWMGWRTLTAIFTPTWRPAEIRSIIVQPLRIKDR